MPASIWLQPFGDQQRQLQQVIDALAARHGTVPFAPHLTVCGADNLDAERAAEYVGRCQLLPFTPRKTGISYSTTTPFKAVVIEVENTPELAAFRETLRRIAGAPEFEPPHISLLYTIDERAKRTTWSTDAAKLSAIAAECAALITDDAFTLGDPVVVAPDGDWSNIQSWKILRRL